MQYGGAWRALTTRIGCVTRDGCARICAFEIQLIEYDVCMCFKHVCNAIWPIQITQPHRAGSQASMLHYNYSAAVAQQLLRKTARTCTRARTKGFNMIFILFNTRAHIQIHGGAV